MKIKIAGIELEVRLADGQDVSTQDLVEAASLVNSCMNGFLQCAIEDIENRTEAGRDVVYGVLDFSCFANVFNDLALDSLKPQDPKLKAVS